MDSVIRNGFENQTGGQCFMYDGHNVNITPEYLEYLESRLVQCQEIIDSLEAGNERLKKENEYLHRTIERLEN